MADTAHRAVAVVGVGAILPDAPDASSFWHNVKAGRYSISEVRPDRWDPALYFDADPKAPDKTYSKIGGWVRQFAWDPIAWHLPIPPRVALAMDDGQKWGIVCTRDVLASFGYPSRKLDLDRTAVILGNAMAGEKHYLTSHRISFPDFARELRESPAFAALPQDARDRIVTQWHGRIGKLFPEVYEDTMPGELSNCLAGRIANLFNFHGPNFTTDAACASALAAMSAAVEGLVNGDYDTALSGGIDRNMGVTSFVKFCKIGALSATGTRPYADGADGFVMGEGAALFLLKRLADAERDGDRIYAVVRGIGGSSDGKGKGLTAPNPIGQILAVKRGWANAGLAPDSCSLIEGHGTSTKVGDVVELTSLFEAFGASGLAPASIPIGSVKSNIGHLKASAGAAGLLKTILALDGKVLPPSLNFKSPNPNLDWASSPFFVNTELREWPRPACGVRRAGVSAFGFGGTNFHVVLEEHVPGLLTTAERRSRVAVPEASPAAPPAAATGPAAPPAPAAPAVRPPLRGALVLGAPTVEALGLRLAEAQREAAAGHVPAPAPPLPSELAADERIAIDFGSATELADKAGKALKALATGSPAVWKPLRAQGIFRGSGPAPKVAFLYTGQGSQYVNMGKGLRELEPIARDTFDAADRKMTPILGRPLTSYIFCDKTDAEAMTKAEEALKQTAITQPSVLALDIALTNVLASFGVRPDMVMGHSLGEYGALVAAGVLPFEDALEAVAARGREMTNVSVADNGKMAAVFAPLADIESTLKSVAGYVVIANYNSRSQAVIGGASDAVSAATRVFRRAGITAVPLQVSHAFHTSIVAPASGPLRQVLERLRVQPPEIPTIANVTGDFYPQGPGATDRLLDLLAQQVASPVQFSKGLETLYDAGARIFIELGPKKALQGFVDDVLSDRPDVVSLYTNHPKVPDAVAVNQALCGFYAAGIGATRRAPAAAAASLPAPSPVLATVAVPARVPAPAGPAPAAPAASLASRRPEASRVDVPTSPGGPPYEDLGRLFAELLEKGMRLYSGAAGAPPPAAPGAAATAERLEPVVVSGASLGLPGRPRVFDDGNVGRILRGEQFIGRIPDRILEAMATKHIIRLVKSEEGESRFEAIDSVHDVIKLAARGGVVDLVGEFGIAAERIPALDTVTRLAIGAGLDAMRDAGIPLVMRWKTTTKGTQLPERWMLPESLQDDTGVIFASAFPGFDSFAERVSGYHIDHERHQRLAELKEVRARLAVAGTPAEGLAEVDGRIRDLVGLLERDAYVFDRRFLFRVLSMGHSQFAELIGARGPNTQINSACASTGVALGLAEDWIRAGRCRRVLIVTSDDATSDNMMEWIGSGFLASGAAAIDEKVEDAALPFDRRRHGMVIGMGAAAIVVEGAETARERGLTPICRLLGAEAANSAFHGTRLDVSHISAVMEKLVSSAEARWGIDRHAIAPRTVFVSHETYTPARGGSASAEVFALRRTFGESTDRIVMANTKGFTGHPMATGIEELVAIKALETGLVPPVANFKEVDPELGPLNLSKGGQYDPEFALRLGAGFGSQVSMTLLQRVPPPDGRRRTPEALGFGYRVHDAAAFRGWLGAISGYDAPELEVERRTLRVKSQGPPKGLAMAAPGTTAKPSEAAVAPAVAPAPAAPTAAPPAPPVDEVAEQVLAIVTAKTGYAKDMLAMDLDLEADLGIDTVKQAELFATVREEWGIPRDDSRKLRDYPTLNHVVRFVYDSRPDLAPKDAAPAAPVAAAAPVPDVPARVPAAPPVLPAPAGLDAVTDRVLGIVTDKTGYAKDMLALELDLEADLGIDTVKQAELFAAVREEWGIPRDDSRKLRDYPTLQHVIQFVYDSRPDLAPAAAPGSAAPEATGVAPAPAPAPALPEDPVRTEVLALVTEKTGYPADMLDPELDLEADLGIDTVKQAELFAAVREAWGIPRDDSRKLRDYPTLAHVIRFVYDNRPDLTPPAGATATAPATPTAAPVAAAEEAPAAVPVGAAEAPPRAAPPAAAPPAEDPVRARVLALVTEKTGYPADMLDPELDLEADLGIDTVKQAELFAAVREAWGIPRDDSRKLRDYPTLAHVIRFVYDNRPDLAPGAAGAAAFSAGPAVPLAAQAPSTERLAGSMEAADRVPRRVAVPVVRPALSACKPTGVSLGTGSRVVVMPDWGGVAETLVGLLSERGVEPLLLPHGASAGAVEAALAAWKAAGPITGVYWLPALDHEGDLPGMDLAAWREALRIRVKLLYATMRALYDDVAAPGTFLVSGTRLGGRHGYDPSGAFAPLGGPVVGFTKAYRRERVDVTAKAVDFAAGATAAEVAALLVEETLRDPGCIEAGHRDGLRTAVGLEVQPVASGTPGMALGKESVFVVTGAAGSIVSAITADLAAASGGTFWLLDLVPEPDRASSDLARFTSDKEGLKRDLFDRIKARGERATPALVEKELAGLERQVAALGAIRAVEEAGGTVHYRSGDLRDAEAVNRVGTEIRATNGKVDVLLHGAGLEISRFLPDKEPREFDLVFDVKCDGWFNLLKALDGVPLGATVAFSSIAGRFGNGGQTDYSSANDLLCKTTSSFRSTRPGTRGIAIDWTAWGDVGMATRGSIPKMMELAGIDMLPAAAGIPIIRRELTSSSFSGELVAGIRLGVMTKELDADGGVDAAALGTRGPMTSGAVTAAVQGPLVVETSLDPKVQAFLFDHRIGGTAVLPGVMGLESFAEAARLLLPGWHVAAVEGVDFQAPFKLYKDEPRTVRVEALLVPDGDGVVARCRLIGARHLPGQAEPQVTVHFTGTVRLAKEPPRAEGLGANLDRPETAVTKEEIYKVYFHGPAYQVLEAVWKTESGVVGLMEHSLPPNHVPEEAPTPMAPRLVELCFQTAGLLEMGTTGKMGLPLHVGRLACPRDPATAGGSRLLAVVSPSAEGGGAADARVVDESGNVYVTLSGYRTVELPGGVPPEDLKPFQTAMA